MSFDYRLEFSYNESSPSDASVYLQMRHNPPEYLPHIDKETFDALPADEQGEFAKALFQIAGVTELSLRAYRIWLMKSPVYTWQEVLEPVLAYLMDFFSEADLHELPGSGRPTGEGFTLGNPNQRRKL